jgi:hypothetical protein
MPLYGSKWMHTTNNVNRGVNLNRGCRDVRFSLYSGARSSSFAKARSEYPGSSWDELCNKGDAKNTWQVSQLIIASVVPIP